MAHATSVHVILRRGSSVAGSKNWGPQSFVGGVDCSVVLCVGRPCFVMSLVDVCLTAALVLRPSAPASK